VFGVLERKYTSLGASGSRPSSVLFRYRLNRYHDGRRTAPPGTGLRLVLHRPHQYVRVPYCSMHVLVETLVPTRKEKTEAENYIELIIKTAMITKKTEAPIKQLIRSLKNSIKRQNDRGVKVNRRINSKLGEIGDDNKNMTRRNVISEEREERLTLNHRQS
jgi:hypothetical protein